MMKATKINTDFTQRCGSCVLASYSIVSNYFIGLPVVQSFEDYCRHFGIAFSSWQEAEKNTILTLIKNGEKENTVMDIK